MDILADLLLSLSLRTGQIDLIAMSWQATPPQQPELPELISLLREASELATSIQQSLNGNPGGSDD